MTNPAITRGFVTMATGDEKYYKFARNLLYSCRLHNKMLPFAIICDRENEYTKEFDDVVVINASTTYSDKFRVLVDSPYDETVFIESDCLVYHNLAEMFELLASGDDFTAFGVNDDDIKVWFIEGIANSEDVLFVLDFKNICNECYELSEAFYFYRRHSNSAVDRNNTENLKKMIRSYIKLVVLCKTRMEDPQYNAKLNYEFWNRHMAYILRYISELPYNERRVVLSELKASKPYLPVNKTNRNRIDKSIIRSIRRSNTLRRIEVANYANHIGAHLISARRKLEDTALGYIIKHPRRVIKNPIGFIKTMKNNNKRRKEAN